jgi:thiamine-phosphate diphosphorylase
MNELKNYDYSIYYVTDEELLHTNYNLYKSVEDAIIGGATMIQLREKNTTTRDFIEKAKKIKDICSKYEVPLIINDRVDVALAIDADGVHLGQDDMELSCARKILGQDKIIGISASNLQEAQIAEKGGADYIGVGAMYSTNTKIDADMTTMEELKIIRKEVKIPIVVIGGINQKTIPDFKDTDIDGLAIVSAIASSDNHVETTKSLKKQFYANNKVKGVILDIDLTMLETEELWDRVLDKIMGKYGFSCNEEDINFIWNNSFEVVSKYLSDKFNLNITEDNLLQDIHNFSIEEYASSNIKLKKGLDKFLKSMRDENIKLAVCTSLSEKQYTAVLKNTGLIDKIGFVFSATDEGFDKGDYRVYEIVSSKLGIHPRNIIAFDDELRAIRAAKRAGMRTILMKNSKNNTKDSYILSTIDYCVDDFDEFMKIDIRWN